MATIKPAALWLCALALVLASSATALADPRAASNIPAAEQNFAASTASPTDSPASTAFDDLPLPYEAWRGTGPQPPMSGASKDVPPPLPQAPELPRRPFELTASVAAFLPSCGSGAIDDRGCLSVSPGSGVDFALLYRVGPFFAVGGEGAVSGFAARGNSALSGAGGGARFFGVAGRLYFADEGAWDPYVALTLGAGTLKLRGDSDARVATTGLGGRVAGGVDYAFGSHLRLGATASFAHWFAWTEQQCHASVCRDQPAAYGRLLGFATLGFRVTGSFGEVL
ncbi:MAG TPA: hypothetical protein VHP33_30335 [Polyangiaceae bacterium]|nr:hypothetical protein [Polyangiaceae bacterium]